MAQEYVFRFMSVRPANAHKKLEQASTKVPLYDPQTKESGFRIAIAKAQSGENAQAEIARLVLEFQHSSQYVSQIEDLSFNVKQGLDWAQMHASLKANDPSVQNQLKTLYGAALTDAVNSQQFQKSLERLADTLFAETMVRNPEDINRDQLAVAHKFMTFLLELANGTKFPPEWTIGDIVGRRTLTAPSPARPARQPVGQPLVASPPTEGSGSDEGGAMRARLADYEQAYRELADLALTPGALVQQPDTKQVDAGRIAALERPVAMYEKAVSGGEAGTQDSSALRQGNTQLASVGRLVISAESVNALSDATKRTLSELKMDTSSLDPILAVNMIERQMNVLGSQLASTQTPNTYIILGGVQLESSRFKKSLGIVSGQQMQPEMLKQLCNFQAGVGDLLMVRQTLKAYELAEFAHVENVLAGETRDREHRRLDLHEEIRTTEQETETEKEKDLQSTQRNEMQTEADKTVKQQFGLEAGLQVSGSYGPSVQFATHLNANFSTTSEDTQRKTVSFSQEVTEKTSERIRQTIKQTVTQRVLQEIQEINKHSFTNTSSTKHIRGIYRWLNKVYDAQIFNYGQRMMYEFVVPEPAAYFLYAMVNNPPGDTELVKPDPPTYLGQPLKATHLTRANYHDFVSKYQVRAVPPPPSEFEQAAYFDKQDNVQDGSTFGRAGKIDVPDGYEAYAASVMSDYIFTQDSNHSYHVMLGNTNFDETGFWGVNYRTLASRRRELSVAYELFNAWSFTLGIDVYCRLTADGLMKWQQQVYDSIIEAYLKLKADYDEKVAALAIQKGPADLGRNPLENQRILKEELKKLILMILTGSDDIALDSFYALSEPLMQLDKVCENGSWIRFFENAFEWTNIVYVLYPYFWGRHARWISAIHLTDPDADFAAFLRAGAARVQVPVRPGFEKAVVYFCQFQKIWDGNDPPLRDDDLYVPIVDEIAANLGKFTNEGVPYPEGSEPWEVRVPTELVLVENVEEVPEIRDILTGQKVSIHG